VRQLTKNQKLSAAAVLVAAGLALFLLRPKSLQWHAERLAGCMESGNIACISEYVSEEELQALDIQRAKVKPLMAFLAKETDKLIGGRKVKGYVFEEKNPSLEGDHRSLEVRTVKIEGDVEVPLVYVEFSKTQFGYRSPRLLTAWAFSVGQNIKVRSPKTTYAPMRKMIAFAETYGPQFGALGMKGAVRKVGEPMDTWQNYANTIRNQLQSTPDADEDRKILASESN
jgi:hypothetical protein